MVKNDAKNSQNPINDNKTFFRYLLVKKTTLRCYLTKGILAES